MTSSTRPAPAVLSDGVVNLRPLLAGDAADITEACQDPQIQQWTTVPQPYAARDADHFIGLHTDPDTWADNPAWAITVMPSNRWSGSIDLRPDGHGGAEVGYMLAPWARGNGNAARALRLACAWAFAALDLEVVMWCAYVGNIASLHTARTVGFQVPDHPFSAYSVQRGERRDSWIGTLTASDLSSASTARQARAAYGGPPLTKRELMVLRHLARGLSNRAIAAELRISENTVKNHVRSVLEKLNAQSRSEAVVIGLRHGLVTLSG